MKVSLNSLKNIYQYLQTGEDATTAGSEVVSEKIGAQLGGIDEIISIGNKYDGVIIVKVVTCESHPNADKLHICKIDDGGKAQGVDRDENGYVQVVCGAPNVRAGMLAAWLPPNSTVPETADKDPFVLGSRELRGVMSNGMLASPKELLFGDSHEGLLVIEGEYAPGTNFAEATGLKDDHIIDIENKMFTHRPDCFGLLGVAREVAGIQGISFSSPDWYVLNPQLPSVEAEELPLSIKNEIPELAPRFTALTMRGVKVGPSPLWLQVELVKCGVRPINNLVDIGNYIMMLTAQPVHVYDYDKVKAHDGTATATLKIRKPIENEELTLLNGKTIKPRTEAIMIATESRAIGLGGVMGGSDTEVSNETTNIIIECASFDMYSIRRTSMEHGIFSDAVARFNKGQSPLQTPAIMSKIVSAIKDVSGGQVAGAFIDDNHLSDEVNQTGSLHPSVTLSASYVNVRLGTNLSVEAMSKLLADVEFEAVVNGDEMTIKAPFWRTDIEIKEDVVEEVGRLYGYDHLPLELPKRDLTPTAKDPLLVLKSEIRNLLCSSGANELLTYSFVHGNLYTKVGWSADNLFELSNALSPDLQYFRSSLRPSLLDKVHGNIKAGFDEFVIFEIGKGHAITNIDEETGLPVANDSLALVVAANDKLKKTDAAYYQAKNYLEILSNHFGVSFNYAPGPEDGIYAKGRNAVVSLDGKNVGTIGELAPEVRKKLKLPEYSACLEISLGSLMNGNKKGYMQLSKFPSVTQDITLKVPTNLQFGDVDMSLKEELSKNIHDTSNQTLEVVGIYQPESDKESRNITWRYTVSSHVRTLTDQEVNGILDGVTNQLNGQGIARV